MVPHPSELVAVSSVALNDGAVDGPYHEVPEVRVKKVMVA